MSHNYLVFNFFFFNVFQANFLTSITELCLLHINSTYADVATGYSQLLSVLPWNITLPILAHMNFEVHSQVRFHPVHHFLTTDVPATTIVISVIVFGLNRIQKVAFLRKFVGPTLLSCQEMKLDLWANKSLDSLCGI